MFGISLKGRGRPDDNGQRVNGSPAADVPPLSPWIDEPGVREIRTIVRPPRPEGSARPDRLSGRLLGGAGLLIFAALVGAAIVTYASQLLFAQQHNHTGPMLTELDQIRAFIVAALPDVGWIAMALVALVAALRGRSSLRARVGVLVFFALSLAAQILYAPPTPQGVLVAIIAPISLAWMLETLIIEVRRWAGDRLGVPMDESPILTGVLLSLVRVLRVAVRLLLWLLRLVFDRRGTWGGVREWVLDVAPLAPGRTRASLEAAAAIAQAGSVEAAAERARAAALAELEQVKAAAEQQVRQARTEALGLVEQIAQENARQMQASADVADQQISAVRAEMAEQLQAVRQAAREDLARVQDEHGAQLRRQQEEAERWRRSAQDQLDRAHASRDELAGELDRVRADYDRLVGSSTAKARLIAAYEQLGAVGDPRWMDRDRVGEVARELHEGAGLKSDGTARAYLYEHINAARGVSA
ncbi:hypothetical protein [Planobispora takensis]|uniref:DUF2637 domain-containing protein n=1 Tax=Planobispora takensis TaxID=1367882 RepID=A0A8J3T3N3_9ACTN|nr:hypothetical protein [Planobispora takensis]GII05744.1 hypothetical protein Pta02_77520 [Planobispora takensis]